MSELDPGNEYLLACTDEAYFSTLKPSEAYLSKLHRLKDYLPEANVIASIGMAGGEDLCTLSKIYGEQTRLIGVDISPIALDLARRATLAAGVNADFIEGNATSLSVPDCSVDGFVLSAMLHEVYSYAEDGKNAFVQTIQEAYAKTSEGGCILISDFAAPRIDGMTTLQPKSQDAKQFIDYFINNFRQFNDTKQVIQGSSINSDPSIMDYSSLTDGFLRLSPTYIAEILWHFKHYKKNLNDELAFHIIPRGWKEINEAYLPPSPYISRDVPMPVSEYVNTVLQICHSAETSRDVSLRCMSAVLASQRPRTINMLDAHFSVSIAGDEASSRSLITECTNWMDLIFKKVPISAVP